MSNDFNERVVATVISHRTAQEQVENRVRYMLDQLTQRLNLPYGMVLEGKVTGDRHGNSSLYVFLRKGWDTFPGRSGIGNEGPRIEEVKGGLWISLNRDDFNPDWVSRELKIAIENYRKQEAEKA